MNTDEKVEWSKRMAELLKGVNDSEFGKWCRYAERDFGKALKFAELMSRSPSLRDRPKETYNKIFRTFQGELREKMEALPKGELSEVLGYLRRWLVAESLDERRTQRPNRGT